MKDSDKNLAGLDAFGLDEFGIPGGMNPMWGAVAGGGLSTVTSMGVRQFATPFGGLYNWSEAIGFGAGALAGGAMLFFEGSRAAGWTALASAFLNSGLRQLEQLLLAPKPADLLAALTKAAASSSAAAANASNGVGMPVIDPAAVLKGGLGIATIEQTQALLGAGSANAAGFAEAQTDMPQLVGAGLAQANQHMQLVGGPPLAQHAGAFGATLFQR